MKSLWNHREKECKAIILFEELEQRIVLDAAVASSVFDSPLQPQHVDHGWTLGYASDPAVPLSPVIDGGDLAEYPAQLDVPVFTFVAPAWWDVVPVDGTNIVDLSGCVSVADSVLPSSEYEFEVTVTYNPNPLTSNGIGTLHFADSSMFQAIWTPPNPTLITGMGTNKWTFLGNPNAITEILSTMQATLIPGFHGTAQIKLWAQDTTGSAEQTDPGWTDSMLLEFEVPYAAGQIGDGTTSIYDVPSPASAPGQYEFTLLGGGPYTFDWDAYNADAAHPRFIVGDRDCDILDLGVRVSHGTLTTDITAATSTTYLIPSGSTGAVTQQVIQISGPTSELDTVLRAMTYTPSTGYHGMDHLDIIAQDNVGMNYTDPNTGTTTMVKWGNDPAKRMIGKSIPFVVA